jgi:type IV secretory pathway VirB2 component (pilin)
MRKYLPLLLFILVLVLPAVAMAAGAGGGAMPWDNPVQKLQQDLTGPFAYAISLLALICCGIILVFGGEINEFVRRLLYAIMVAAFLVAVQNTATALGIAGATV